MFEKYLAQKSQVPQAFDGRKLQIFIGLLAISLPFTLVVTYSVLKPDACGSPVLSAISAYFHSKVGTYFTGVLFALAMAMFAFKGEREIEPWLANFAALMAIMVAVFPTSIDEDMARSLGNYCLLSLNPPPDPTLGTIHYVAAVLLFVALIIFCFLFKMSGPSTGKRQVYKNLFYNACALSMCLTMIFMALYSFDFIINKEWFAQHGIPPILIGETFCLVLFGLSWLVRYSDDVDIAASAADL